MARRGLPTAHVPEMIAAAALLGGYTFFSGLRINVLQRQLFAAEYRPVGPLEAKDPMIFFSLSF